MLPCCGYFNFHLKKLNFVTTIDRRKLGEFLLTVLVEGVSAEPALLLWNSGSVSEISLDRNQSRLRISIKQNLRNGVFIDEILAEPDRNFNDFGIKFP